MKFICTNLPNVALVRDLLTGRVASPCNVRRRTACRICESGATSRDECVLDRSVEATIGICLAGIPEHDASKTRKTLAHLDGICAQCSGIYIARSSSGARGWSSEIDLHVLVRTDVLCPIIPEMDSAKDFINYATGITKYQSPSSVRSVSGSRQYLLTIGIGLTLVG